MPTNVLMILSDQHNANWLGAAGHTQVYTPHLDSLAASGLRCDQAWCQNTICTPSRVSILSGQYPHQHGYFGLSGPTPQQLPSLFSHFHGHGYRTAGIGKLHLPNHPVHWLHNSADLLLEIHAGLKAGEPSPYTWYLRGLGLEGVEDSRGLRDCRIRGDHEGRPSAMPFQHSVEQWMVRQAKAFVERSVEDQQPFFMQLSFPRPHHALTPDQQFWDMYDGLALPPGLHDDCQHRPPHFQRVVEYLRSKHEWAYEPKEFTAGSQRCWRATLASVTQNDYCIGQMLAHVQALGIEDDTIVIYSSDHGAYHGIHGVMEKAPGISSREVCRIPLIWRIPGMKNPGRVCTDLMESVDIAATLPGLCGLPAMQSVQGVNQQALLCEDGPGARRMAVTELPLSKSLRFDGYRFVHYHRSLFAGEDHGELYRDDDLMERNNLYYEPEYAAVVQEGRRLLLEWLSEHSKVRTAWPAPGACEGAQGAPPYINGGDGYEPAGLHARRLSDPRAANTDPRHYL